MPLPSNITCQHHQQQQQYISAICLYTGCNNQPALCQICLQEYHNQHQQFCYTFEEIEQKALYLDQNLDIRQPYMIFKKEIIGLLNHVGTIISQSTFSFQSRYFSSDYKHITSKTINELGQSLRNSQEQISKRHQIISYFNEFLAEFEKRTKQFINQIQYQFPKKTYKIDRDEDIQKLTKRKSESMIQSNNVSKIELSRISRAMSNITLDNQSRIILQQDFNKTQFRIDFNQIVGDAIIINDYSLKSNKGCMALIYPPLNDITNNYIKLSFKIEFCQGLVCIGVSMNTDKCNFANIDSRGKVYSSGNFQEHNKQCKIKFGQNDTITVYVNKHQQTIEFQKNDRNIEVKLSKINMKDMKFYVYLTYAQVTLKNNKEILNI